MGLAHLRTRDRLLYTSTDPAGVAVDMMVAPSVTHSSMPPPSRHPIILPPISPFQASELSITLSTCSWSRWTSLFFLFSFFFLRSLDGSKPTVMFAPQGLRSGLQALQNGLEEVRAARCSDRRAHLLLFLSRTSVLALNWIWVAGTGVGSLDGALIHFTQSSQFLSLSIGRIFTLELAKGVTAIN